MSGSEERPSSESAAQPSAGQESAGQESGASGESGRHGLDELIAERRSKAKRLRESDDGAFPYAFTGVESIDAILPVYEHLAPGEETDERHRVAGRIAARRGAGKAAFLDLIDRTGKIQLHARVDVLGRERFDLLRTLDLGDLIGVDGSAIRSRHGEISLRVESFQVLAKALRPPPDKHHGLSDVQTRYRRRELDLIANEDARKVFMARAHIIAAVRSYLDGHGFIEVETPILQSLYGGALARPFTTHHNALERDLYMRIATELYLKRCIVGGLERVYELGKDFRNEGISHKHNPEFTMVEWYEAYADYSDEAERLEALVRQAAAAIDYAGEFDFLSTWRRVTFAEAIAEQTGGIDVLEHRDVDRLRAAIATLNLDVQINGDTWFQLADDLLSKLVEPTLLQPTFVTDYPVELSPFAREHRTQEGRQKGLVERWEAFAGGMEIANAFSELIDPDVQRERFQAQQRLETLGEEEFQPYDETFVQALEQGMPPTGGVGLGIDRLVMLLTGRDSIREVVLFPAMRD
ncbi:MAG TPA: lysine--tRNA ligase [Solirubrobacteraceae bacterium]|nr:lysine--tRNA ligase [Solirubrobacteraceae bacterium]